MKANQPPLPQRNHLARLFAIWFGVLLGVTLLKFVNPAVFDRMTDWPSNGYEWALNPWPVGIGYALLAVTVLFGVFVARPAIIIPRWLMFLPIVWLGWQFVAATHTVDAELTRSTLKHFAACVVCFYLGLFALAQSRNPMIFLLPICVAFVATIAVGIEQRFGGLEASRKYFLTYVYPQMTSVPEDYLKRLSSDRIFATQFYPNALAGLVLLLLPVTLAAVWQSERRLTVGARAFLAGLVGVLALASLYWSGSKGGWLLMLVLGLVALLQLRLQKQIKMILVSSVLIIGLTGFALKYAGFFQRGAKSVNARFDYWQSAVKTTLSNPVVGGGPGTFGATYKTTKRPESEMARLAHNDYLQQASDSGVFGFLAYFALIVGSLTYGRPMKDEGLGHALRFCVWLGVLGWSLQSLSEFGLYIPSLAWCSFGWMGWLLGTAKPFDKCPSAPYPQTHR